MARAVATGFSLKMLSPYLIQDSGQPDSMLEFAFNELRTRVSRKVIFDGNLVAKSKESAAVAQAICSAYSFHQIDAAKNLASLFRTEEDCYSALAMVVSKTVDFEDWAALVNV